MSVDPSPPADDLVDRAMDRALLLAEQAAQAGEVPVAAVLMDARGAVLAEAHNEIEGRRDPTAHAERLVLTAACARLGAPRLPPGALLAVTLEPCAMCAGALVLARLDWLCFATPDPKTGACGSLRDIVGDERLNHRVGLLAPRATARSAELLRAFFRERRGSGPNPARPRPEPGADAPD